MTNPATVDTVHPVRATTLTFAAALTGSAALAVAELLAPGPWYPWTLVLAVLAGGGFLAIIDARTHTLPNRYTGPLALAGVLQVLAHTISTSDPWQLLWAAVTAAVIFLLFAVLGIWDHVGFGDAKYAAALGVFAAITTGLFAIYIMPAAVLLGAAGRGIRYLAGHRNKRQALGPYILAATIAAMIYGILILR